ncbi:MAG: hypothetical protein II088_04840, partial [Bacteroidales bacterium]|nr:hypothetical protein [Bacteroidales bacterium]
MKNIHYIFFVLLASAVVCSCKSKTAEPTADENEAKIEEVANASLLESDTVTVEEEAFELEMKTYRVVKAANGCSFTYHAVLPADTDNKAILAIRDDVLGEISNGVDVDADFRRSAAKSVSMYQEAIADSTDEYFEYFEEYDLDSIYPVLVTDGFIAMAYYAFYEISTAPRSASEYHYMIYDLATEKEIVIYGRTCLMTSKFCPIGKNENCHQACKKRIYELKDRRNFVFPVVIDITNCHSRVYNSKISSIDYTNINTDFVRIDILNESEEEIKN